MNGIGRKKKVVVDIAYVLHVTETPYVNSKAERIIAKFRACTFFIRSFTARTHKSDPRSWASEKQEALRAKKDQSASQAVSELTTLCYVFSISGT